MLFRNYLCRLGCRIRRQSRAFRRRRSRSSHSTSIGNCITRRTFQVYEASKIICPYAQPVRHHDMSVNTKTTLVVKIYNRIFSSHFMSSPSKSSHIMSSHLVCLPCLSVQLVYITCFNKNIACPETLLFPLHLFFLKHLGLYKYIGCRETLIMKKKLQY